MGKKKYHFSKTDSNLPVGFKLEKLKTLPLSQVLTINDDTHISMERIIIKVPRKKKKKIPFGVYCYGGFAPNPKTNGVFSIRIKPCLFYEHVEGLEGHCRLLKSEITDQVKDCGINSPIN